MTEYKFQNSIYFLLGYANPSIKLRVKKEILGNISPAEEAELLTKTSKFDIGFHPDDKNKAHIETTVRF